ncbi:hypothetical protein [Thermococcus sp. Bubb.Bath]|uniref:hypothetical protein n=1 Tax=Thermococcus sp. Bubb.Bath TaxID=1638242 RepID=UPI00143ADFE6|nr:hypothetical protein [Thermococcus sp. Bubb.Bath]NJF24802.1 hypothetical protein [Thermococcus sp. Bubb.Bath]
MRLTTKNIAVKEALTRELKGAGIKFEMKSRPSYEAFVGYFVEGTLDEIGTILKALDGVDSAALMEGYNSFKESLYHILEHLKEGADFGELLNEAPWVADIVDQLFRGGVIESEGEHLKLREGADVAGVRFQFKFPFELVTDPEKLPETVKQFVFTDLVVEYEFEILELDIGRINSLGSIAGKYFPEDYVLKVYFALIGRAILASEVLNALGAGKVDLEGLEKSFLRAMPLEIPTEKGSLVVHATKESMDELLRFLEKEGYVDIKAGKVRKLRDL